MTAEAAVMNKHAVALAADSAVTVQVHGGQKIYNTVNKLFTLSKHAPVGVMIYGSAEFVGVPWETIIKRFRQVLGARRHDTLQGYAEEFLRHISEDPLYIDSASSSRFVRRFIAVHYALVLEKIRDAIRRNLDTQRDIDDHLVSQVANDVVEAYHEQLAEQPDFDGLPADFDELFHVAHDGDVRAQIEATFELLPLSPECRVNLGAIARQSLRKRLLSGQTSGVVVAGFGEHDLYPRIRNYEIDGALCGFVRMLLREAQDIGDLNEATIHAFAQREVVATFIEGIDPVMKLVLQEALQEAFRRLPDTVLGTVQSSSITVEQRANIDKHLDDLGRDVFAKISGFSQERHINPIISAVGVLPKDELAAMAEALVNLTSFRRRVSTDAETVGGPVDVAVISKGDGFVWIKRKHYFRPELNPGFLANYYRPEEQP